MGDGDQMDHFQGVKLFPRGGGGVKEPLKVDFRFLFEDTIKGGLFFFFNK